MDCARLTLTRTGANVIETGAASVSLLCLAHCMALPALLLAPGALGLFVRSETFHVAAVALVAPAAGLAFWTGYRLHGYAAVALLGFVGILCLGAALLGGATTSAEPYVMASGSAVLVLAHVLNWRLRSRAS